MDKIKSFILEHTGNKTAIVKWQNKICIAEIFPDGSVWVQVPVLDLETITVLCTLAQEHKKNNFTNIQNNNNETNVNSGNITPQKSIG